MVNVEKENRELKLIIQKKIKHENEFKSQITNLEQKNIALETRIHAFSKELNELRGMEMTEVKISKNELFQMKEEIKELRKMLLATRVKFVSQTDELNSVKIKLALATGKPMPVRISEKTVGERVALKS